MARSAAQSVDGKPDKLSQRDLTKKDSDLALWMHIQITVNSLRKEFTYDDALTKALDKISTPLSCFENTDLSGGKTPDSGWIGSLPRESAKMLVADPRFVCWPIQSVLAYFAESPTSGRSSYLAARAGR